MFTSLSLAKKSFVLCFSSFIEIQWTYVLVLCDNNFYTPCRVQWMLRELRFTPGAEGRASKSSWGPGLPCWACQALPPPGSSSHLRTIPISGPQDGFVPLGRCFCSLRTWAHLSSWVDLRAFHVDFPWKTPWILMNPNSEELGMFIWLPLFFVSSCYLFGYLSWIPSFFVCLLRYNLHTVKFCTDLEWQAYKFWQMYTPMIYWFHYARSFCHPPSQSKSLTSRDAFRILTSWFWTILESPVNGTTQYELFCVWLFSLIMMFLRFIQLAAHTSRTQDVTNSLTVGTTVPPPGLQTRYPLNPGMWPFCSSKSALLGPSKLLSQNCSGSPRHHPDGRGAITG